MGAKMEMNTVILLIENDEADIFLFRRALASLNFQGQMRVVGSVTEARDYLEGRGAFSDRQYYPLPGLIVSDMGLPGQTGNEFLAWMREHPSFSDLPFVFLSGTSLPLERERAERLRPDDFLAKSGDIGVLRSRVANMLKFLPPAKASTEPPKAA
jgi:CheY-like chemotaxis protein